MTVGGPESSFFLRPQFVSTELEHRQQRGDLARVRTRASARPPSSRTCAPPLCTCGCCRHGPVAACLPGPPRWRPLPPAAVATCCPSLPLPLHRRCHRRGVYGGSPSAADVIVVFFGVVVVAVVVSSSGAVLPLAEHGARPHRPRAGAAAAGEHRRHPLGARPPRRGYGCGRHVWARAGHAAPRADAGAGILPRDGGGRRRRGPLRGWPRGSH